MRARRRKTSKSKDKVLTGSSRPHQSRAKPRSCTWFSNGARPRSIRREKTGIRRLQRRPFGCGEPRKRLTSHAVESGSFELRTAEKQRLRVGDVAGGGTKRQRLHEVLLGDAA